MYGTVARFTARPGSDAALQQLGREEGPSASSGYRFHHIYRLDSGKDEYILVAGFENKESYVANANSPEQNAFYERFRALLVSDPEWMDGEIIDSGMA
ncbi:MAG: antibiotic biosynthesis monooxygenase [Thermomicrobiales bacterium]|nr:antibiotic biosynthesis monooxygenase [Thermomicrobiales bacterium]